MSTNTFRFKTAFQPTLHPETGVTQIIFDQFISIAKHYQNIRDDTGLIHPVDIDEIDPVPENRSSVNSLTRGKLIKHDDWNEWEQAEKAQLDLFETQQMFSTPTKLPNEHGINVLVMIKIGGLTKLALI